MKIYNWFACDGECGGFLCCKPLGHSGKCEAKFNDSTSQFFDYKPDGLGEPCPITIKESDISKFNLNRAEIV